MFKQLLILFFCLLAYQSVWAQVGVTCIFTSSLSEQNITPEEAVAGVLEGKSPSEQIGLIICITQALENEDLTALEAALTLVLSGYPNDNTVFNAVAVVYGLSKEELERLISELNRQKEFGTIPNIKEDGGGGTVSES